jgi:hypothetical protein
MFLTNDTFRDKIRKAVYFSDKKGKKEKSETFSKNFSNVELKDEKGCGGDRS